MRVLIAVDGSIFSDAAVEEIGSRLWAAGTEMMLLTVVEPPLLFVAETYSLPAEVWEETERVAETRGREILQAAHDRLRHKVAAEVNVSSELLKGYPRQVILDEAERWGADLIVVGSHGYRGLTRLLLGSVSQALASHAHCSVEIVRARPAAETTEGH